MVTESIEEINLADYLVTSTWKCTIFVGFSCAGELTCMNIYGQ